jgi:hypothetical protein
MLTSEGLKGPSVLKAEAEGWSVLTSCLKGSVLRRPKGGATWT